jgi:hypothetical protein
MKAKLTVKNVSRLKPIGAGQTDYFDSVLPGFCLRVSSTGARSYCCTYRVNRKFVRQTIGPISRIGLAQARAKARQIYAVAEEGRDPRIERRAAVADAIKADADTYAGAVENFIQVYAIGKKKNRSHTEQRRLLLKVNERWHSRPVSSITKREVSDALDEMVTEGKGYAANRTFTVLSTFFKWLDQRDRVPININQYNGEGCQAIRRRAAKNAGLVGCRAESDMEVSRQAQGRRSNLSSAAASIRPAP